MKRIGLVVAAAALTAAVAWSGASPTPAAASDTKDEFTCQATMGAELGKFCFKKMNELAKCDRQVQKGNSPSSDCSPPFFGGKTGDQIEKLDDSAHEKIKAKCSDPLAGGTDSCPECWGSTATGCNSIRNTQMNKVSDIVDSLTPLLLCNDTASVDGLTATEAACRQEILKRAGKFAFKDSGCLKKCWANVFAGKTTGCNAANTTDAATVNCRSKEEVKAAAAIAKKCPARPQCVDAAFPNFPDDLIELLVGDMVNVHFVTYCRDL
jgi:hypothetical protein